MWFRKTVQRITPSQMMLLLLILIWDIAVYGGSRLITARMPHFNWECGLDRQIPFVPWTVSVYLICYLFWTVNYVLAVCQSEEACWRFVSGELLGKTICLFFFLLVPTTNVRPYVEPGGFWNQVMRCLYSLDAADNLFPSIHCMVSWFCFVAVRNNPYVPKGYRWFSLIFCGLICISTLTTKQHVLADVVGGVAFAEISYQTACRTGLDRKFHGFFQTIMEKARPLFPKEAK